MIPLEIPKTIIRDFQLWNSTSTELQVRNTDFHCWKVLLLLQQVLWLSILWHILPDELSDYLEQLPNINTAYTMTGNDVVLSYRDSVLRCSDLEILQGPCWLNDTLISFYFEYLEEEHFKNSPYILFVPPQVTQCIKITQSAEIRIFLDPLNARNKSFIFFALNDNEFTECAGGTHWSLLVFSKPEKMVYHYDSMQESNRKQAVALAAKLLRHFNMPYELRFTEVPCLQQDNSYDCGIHVLCNAERLALYASRTGRISGCPHLSPNIVFGMRSNIMDVIGYLRDHEHR